MTVTISSMGNVSQKKSVDVFLFETDKLFNTRYYLLTNFTTDIFKITILKFDKILQNETYPFEKISGIECATKFGKGGPV